MNMPKWLGVFLGALLLISTFAAAAIDTINVTSFSVTSNSSTYSASNVIGLNAYAVTNGTLAYKIFILDGSNHSVSANANYTQAGLQPGYHSWSVFANNTAGNLTQSSTYQVYIAPSNGEITPDYNGTDVTNGLFNLFGGTIDGVQQQGVNIGLMIAIMLVSILAVGAFTTFTDEGKRIWQKFRNLA